MDVKAKNITTNVAMIGAVLVGGVAFAQGIGHMPAAAPPAGVKAPVHAAPVHKTPAQKAANPKADAEHKRIVDWFTKYDQIRLEAQMTPDEKNNAHKLFTAFISGNEGDKKSSKALLDKMIGRYTKAIAEMKTLPKVPATSKLQDGYQRYFTEARSFFQRWEKALDENKIQDAISELQSGRHELGMLDVSNKMLDKKLRRDYNIKPFPGN